jgi:hypothetical protein
MVIRSTSARTSSPSPLVVPAPADGLVDLRLVVLGRLVVALQQQFGAVVVGAELAEHGGAVFGDDVGLVQLPVAVARVDVLDAAEAAEVAVVDEPVFAGGHREVHVPGGLVLFAAPFAGLLDLLADGACDVFAGDVEAVDDGGELSHTGS